MKLSKLFSLAVISSSLLMSASSYAGTLQKSFVSSNNIVFTIHNTREVTFNSGAVSIISSDGSNSYSYLQDASGSVANSVKNSVTFGQSFVRVGTSQRYINADLVKYTVCTSSGTTLGWSNSGSEDFTDGCQLHNSMKNAAN